jgi:hypothetical protein
MPIIAMSDGPTRRLYIFSFAVAGGDHHGALRNHLPGRIVCTAVGLASAGCVGRGVSVDA